MLALCSLCHNKVETLSGTLLVQFQGNLSKEKYFPSSKREDWYFKDNKTYYILRYCPKCYEKYVLKKNIYGVT